MRGGGWGETPPRIIWRSVPRIKEEHTFTCAVFAALSLAVYQPPRLSVTDASPLCCVCDPDDVPGGVNAMREGAMRGIVGC